MSQSVDNQTKQLDEILAIALTAAYTRGKTTESRERIFEVTQAERDDAKHKILAILAKAELKGRIDELSSVFIGEKHVPIMFIKQRIIELEASLKEIA